MVSISALGPAPASLVKRTLNPLARVAQVLDMSTEELKEQLRDGKSLNDVAQEQGVTHDNLISALKSTLPWPDAPAAAMSPDTSTAAAVSPATSSAAVMASAPTWDIDEIAEKMAGTVGTIPPRPPLAPPPAAGRTGRGKGFPLPARQQAQAVGNLIDVFL